jgi:prepilin-type processing-associated H-X9-DG protein
MKKAITKTDLVVVILCCVFILALSGAAGRTARMCAKETMCTAKLGQWRHYWQGYIDDHDGMLIDNIRYAGPMEAYYHDVKMLKCPAATKTSYFDGAEVPFTCWIEDAPNSDYVWKAYIGSYTFNGWCTRIETGNRPYEYLWRTPKVPDADMIPLLMDGGGPSMNVVPLPEDVPPEYEGAPEGSNIGEINRICLNRHNGGINILFLDYSVRKVGLKGLWELHWSKYWRDHEIPEPTWPEWMSDFKDYR